MMEREIKKTGFEYSDELKIELDDLHANHKKGRSKLVTAAESKKHINNLLKKRKDK